MLNAVLPQPVYVIEKHALTTTHYIKMGQSLYLPADFFYLHVNLLQYTLYMLTL